MYILIGLMVAFVGLQTYTTISTKGTPQQPYSVLKAFGELELRRYPEALSATVLRPGTTYKEVSSSGFRSLAGYIFGGNEAEQKIAMTAPVHMEMGSDSSCMRFVMPEGLDWDNMPAPDDPNVKLERLPEEVVAALRFGGFANDDTIAEWSTRLLQEVSEAGLEPIGPVRFLGYDPPWQLVARRNEVVVSVRWP
ncbi:MAG: heme-binding protein [Flavobacteriales bacterium]